MTNRVNGTLYVGSATHLARRAWEHREGVADGFTKQYGLKRLRLFRAIRRYSRGQTARKRDEALAARLEGAAHSWDESGMEGFVRYTLIVVSLVWLPTDSAQSRR